MTCAPDPGSSSYGGAVTARPKLLNARGSSSRIQATGGPEKVPIIIGSQSYNYAIPILSLPGRAGMDLNLSLYYNSRVWGIDTIGHTATFNVDRDFPSYGFRLDFGYMEYDTNGDQFILTERDGTKRALPDSNGFISTDGSYVVANFTTKVVTYKNGTTVQYAAFPSDGNLFRPTQIKDTNGNYITITYLSGHDQLIQSITDTLGRVINFHYNGSNQLSYIDQNVAVSTIDPTGVHRYVTFTWGSIYGSNYSWYNFSGLTVNGAPALSTALQVLTGCTYANSTGYRFTYGDWGIVDKIENLSATGITRNYVSYNYPLASAGALTDAPAYTQQTISPDGTSTSVWNYSVTKAGTGVVTAMQVTDPLGDITITNLDQSTGLLSSTQMKDSSGHLLRTIANAWTLSGGANVPSTVTTTLNDTGQQSSVQYSNYDTSGDPGDVYEYDFGGALLRHTVTTYASTPFTTQHILGLPTEVLVKDGAGNTVSRTDYGYDTTSTTNITDAASHDNTLTVHGNLTLIKRYSNAAAGTGEIDRHLFYDSTGNIRTAELDCCVQKVFNFSVANQYAYPNSVVRGSSLQFTTSDTWNFDKGLMLTSTDENGQVTQYQYDSMNRPTGTTLPSQGATSVQLITAYDDNALSPTVTKSATPSTVTAPTVVTTMDGLGHILQVDTKNGSTTVSSTTVSYDKLWRANQQSNPFAPSDTPVYTSFAYDPLGRTTQVFPPSGGYTQYDYSGNTITITDPAGKQRKNYMDALGRLVEVDEPNGSTTGTGSTASVAISGQINMANSASGTAPPAAASNSSLNAYFDANDVYHIFYEGANQHLYEIYGNGNVPSGYTDLTFEAGSPLAASGSALAFFMDSSNEPHWSYVGSDQHLYQIYLISDGYHYADLTSWSGNSPLAISGSPLTSSFQASNWGQIWSYLGTNGHIYQIYSSNTTGPAYADVTASTTGAPAAASGSPLGFYLDTTNESHWSYISSNQHLNLIYEDTSSVYHYVDLTTWAGNSPLAVSAGAMTTSFQASNFGQIWSYLGSSNQHIYEIYSSNTTGPAYADVIGSATGAPAAASGSALAFYLDTTNEAHWDYISSNQHLNLIYQDTSNGYHYVDLTTWAGNSPLAGSAKPLTASFFASNFGQAWSYLGSNQHLYEIYSSTTNTVSYADLNATAPLMVTDSGTVSLNVGGFTATACFGNSTNPSCTGQPVNSSTAEVASALALALNSSSSPVTASASGSTINMTWRTPGPFIPPVAALTTTHDNTSLFSGPSFTSAATNFSGGVGAVNSSPNITTYTYDPLGNLTGVSLAALTGQPTTGQPRSYSYDGLGRFTSSTTPEAGTVTNYYTNSGGSACAGDPTVACRVQDARGVVKNLSYDAINRLTGITYTNDPANTPPVSYHYDAGGAAAFALARLTSITEGPATPTPVNSHTYTYDNFGRILSDAQSIDQQTYTVGYGYNFASELTSITYPSGRVVTQGYDAIGRTASVASGSTTYLSGLSYNSAGQMLGLTMGNGVQGAFTYNDHSQLQSLRYSKAGVNPDPLNLGYSYTSAAQLNNNGQIQAVHFYTQPGAEDQTKSESFTYDPLGRLQAAQTLTVNGTAGTWSLQWGYDRFGNRLSQTLVGGNVTIGQPNFIIDSTTNRIASSGYTYDAAGNMTHDATAAYTFDGTDRLITINTSAAVYTYMGVLRIKKVVGSTTTRYVYSGNHPIAEYVNGSTTPSTEYIYSGPRLLVTIAGSNTTYHHPDHLSNRAETNSSGTVTRTFGHFPFGEIWYETGTADKWKFTSYERDLGTGETGLDYAQNRFYASSQARFMSSDPSGTAAFSLPNPQTLNAYSYVINDPINLLDPQGLDCVYLNDAGDGVEQVDTNSDMDSCSGSGGYWVDGAFVEGWFSNDSNSVILQGLGGDGTYNLSFTNYDLASTPDLSDGLSLSGLFDSLSDFGVTPYVNLTVPQGVVFKMWITPTENDCNNEVRYGSQYTTVAKVDGMIAAGLGLSGNPFAIVFGAHGLAAGTVGEIKTNINAPACNWLRTHM